MAEHYIYKPSSDAIVKTIGSEEQGWRFYFVLTKISPTPTNTPSSTVGSTPTGTPTNTPTPSITKSQTPTKTPTVTPTPTATYLPPEVSPSNTSTPPATPTNTPTNSPVGVTPTPSNTPNISCGTQFIFNGPFDCMDAVQLACYAQNPSNNLTVYANYNPSGGFIALNDPVFIDSNCNQYLNPDGFYTINVYYDQNGSPVSIERQIIYIKNGHVLYYLGGCSGLAYFSCYSCGPTGCSQITDPIKLAQQLLYVAESGTGSTACEILLGLCGTYVPYYCGDCDENNEPLCCSLDPYGGPFGNFADCQDACPN